MRLQQYRLTIETENVRFGLYEKSARFNLRRN
jgi:hypothetical protein